MARIFISYSTQSAEPTRALAAFLQSQGHAVWWDTNIRSGEVYRDVINRELNAADLVIVIWTPHSIASNWVIAEAEHADSNKKLVTLRTADIDARRIPMPFTTYHTPLADDHAAVLAALSRLGTSGEQERGAGVSANSSSATSVDDRAFREAETDGSVEALQFYLDEFPQGGHAPLARFRLNVAKENRARRDRETAEGRAKAEVDRYRAEGRVKIDAKFVHGAPAAAGGGAWFKPGAGKFEWFKDHEHGPEMVVVPAGSFTMGSPDSEPGRWDLEDQLRVTIAQSFAVGRFVVTFAEWDAAAAEGVCGSYRPSDRGWGRGKQPVINVDWDNARAYVIWLGQKTGQIYRLLSEAEWEFVARAGTTTPFWWGVEITPERANYNGASYPVDNGERTSEFRRQAVSVDSFSANPWGLYNVHGNVWEFTEDFWNNNNTGNPGTGGARTSGDNARRVVRGGAWGLGPNTLRSASRQWGTFDARESSLGFRVARTLSF